MKNDTIEEDRALKILELLQPQVSKLVDNLMELLISSVYNTKFYKKLMRENPYSEISIVSINEEQIHISVDSKTILYDTQVLYTKGELC